MLQFVDYPDQSSIETKVLGAAYVTSEGITYPTVWDVIDIQTRANQLCRIVAEGKLVDTTPGGLQCARVSGRVEFKSA